MSNLQNDIFYEHQQEIKEEKENIMSNYKEAIQALSKALKLDDKEVLDKLRSTLYTDFGRYVAFEIEDQADILNKEKYEL